MRNKSPTFKLSDGEAGGFATLQRGLQLWWYSLPVAVRSPVWPAIVAVLIIFGMLMAFHEVVSGAVQQSLLRNKATAMHSEATWRCNALQGARASENCLSRLNAVVSTEILMQARITPEAYTSEAQAVWVTGLSSLSSR